MVFNSDFVLTLIGGFVIALFANRVSKFWNKNKVEIEKKGLTLDDMIKIKTGYHPNWLDAVVHAAVSWTDQYLSDPKMVRQITRKVIEVTDPNKRNFLTTELKGAVSKLESGIITKLDENLSPELKEIVNQVKNNNIKLSDIAILYRSNAQSRVFEENLLRHNLPYKIYNHTFHQHS